MSLHHIPKCNTSHKWAVPLGDLQEGSGFPLQRWSFPAHQIRPLASSSGCFLALRFKGHLLKGVFPVMTSQSFLYVPGFFFPSQ